MLKHELSARPRTNPTFWRRGPWCLLLIGLLASCDPLGFKGFDYETMSYAFVEGRVTTQAGQPVAGASVLAFIAKVMDGTCATGELSNAQGWTDAQGNYRLELKESDFRSVFCLRIAVQAPAGSDLLISVVEAPNVTLREDKRTATTVTVNVVLENR